MTGFGSSDPLRHAGEACTDHSRPHPDLQLILSGRKARDRCRLRAPCERSASSRCGHRHAAGTGRMSRARGPKIITRM
jgi:hypothetical protein